MKSPKNLTVLSVLFVGIFCTSFVYFYSRQGTSSNLKPTEIEKNNEKLLPEAKIFNLKNEVLSNDELRKGKVILIFVSPSCDACQAEGEFLKDLIKKRNDLKFYGIVSFGKAKETLEASANIFPFQVFYDSEASLTLKLNINKVPIKIYLEDGIIKKIWGGATTDESKKQEFIDWLENI